MLALADRAIPSSSQLDVRMTGTPRDLVQLFVDLVRGTPGAEWVDDLKGTLPRSLFEGEHGDFLLDQRSIIGERGLGLPREPVAGS